MEIANPIDYHNLGFRAVDRPVNRIRVYFTRELKAQEMQKLTWEIYTSDDGEKWFRYTLPVRIAYEIDPGRFQTVAVVTTAGFINDYGKLVLRTAEPIFDPFEVTEIEVGEFRIATSDTVKSHYENWRSESMFSLTGHPTDDWSLGARFDYDFEHREDSDFLDEDQIETNYSLFSDYYLNRFFWLSLGFSENRTDYKNHSSKKEYNDNPDEMNRSCTAAWKANPIDTVDLSLAYNHGEDFEDGDKTDTSDNVIFNLAAQLYPDVSSDFSYYWEKSDGDTETNWRLDLTARLTEEIDINSYIENNDAYGVNGNWRPSDIFTVTVHANRDNEDDTSSGGAGIAWVCTDTLRSNFNYNIIDTPETTEHIFNSTMNWIPCDLVTVLNNFTYQHSRRDGNIINWNLQLTLNY